MSDVLTTVSTRRTPQSQPADARQVKNAAGGHTFVIDDWARVHRFLTLGTDGGTYYTTAKDLTVDTAAVILRAAATDPLELVRRIVEISTGGRAPKQNPALFALAIAAAADDVDGKRAALAALPLVARTGTHLFTFARCVEQFRGWGPTLTRAVGKWYSDKPIDDLAYQVVKYRQRDGYTHRDMLRLGHPVADGADRRALFDFICGRHAEVLPPIVCDFIDAQQATKAAEWVDIIARGNGISWEMLPDAAVGHADVWAALIDARMPITALIKQLPRLTRLGVTRSHREAITRRLTDAEVLKRGRVHPINVLVALRTYASGHSAHGNTTWSPDSRICDALDAAFYAAYGAVEPTGKRELLAVDISGSMSNHPVSGLPLNCREAAAALTLVTAAAQPDHRIIGFTGIHERSSWGVGIRENTITELDISPRRRLDDVIRYTESLDMGQTDCAAPMVWAMRNNVEVDTFTILTDNETWCGNIHPHQALREYRERTGIPARLCVVAMTATGNSIADPSDPGQLDVSGFDSAVPQLLSAFSRGDI
jgi:60 kDa SS-A/Ro ribonucleoprotein